MERREALVYGDWKWTGNGMWMWKTAECKLLCASRNMNVGGTKAASLDLCVWFWFIIKHGESDNRKGWWSSKGAGLIALCKFVLFLIYQYDEREFWLCREVVAQQQCISSADCKEVCSLERSETGGWHSYRRNVIKM